MKRTPEFYAAIIALKGKMTASEVGAKFGITRNAVIGIWHRAKSPPISDETRAQMQFRGYMHGLQQRSAGK